MPTQPTLRLMIVAGEASGDAHAASLAGALVAAAPETQFEFFGATGALMRAAGVDSVIRADELAILGLWEIARALPKFWRAYQQLKRAAVAHQPAAVILVDWPDFNLRLAHWLHRRGFRVIYYISPQLWAWRSYRARGVRRDVDLLLSILPFEKDWYAQRGMTGVKYVGHPLTGEVHAEYAREEFCRRHDLDPSRPIVSLLPGSRRNEVDRILPPMLESAAVITKQRPEIQFVVVVAPNRNPDEAQEIIAAGSYPLALADSLRVVNHATREALAASDAAAIASGTATLEAALLGTPMVIVYKESFINWHVLGSLIVAPHYGLVNLIAGRRLITELMQNDLNAERLSQELLELLDTNRNAAIRTELKDVVGQLGEPGASQRAAREILEFLESTKQ